MMRPVLLLAVVAALAPRVALAAFDPATLTSLSQLRPMSDEQLASVFATGTAVIPSQEPPNNATGEAIFDMCVGRTLFSAFTPNSSVVSACFGQQGRR